MAQPIDKGVVTAAVEQYPTNELNHDNTPKMKSRYARIGRATLWPSEQGKMMPNIKIELDTLPIGHSGKLEMSVFWDSENPNAQPQQQMQQQQQYQQPAPGGYQQTRG